MLGIPLLICKFIFSLLDVRYDKTTATCVNNVLMFCNAMTSIFICAQPSLLNPTLYNLILIGYKSVTCHKTTRNIYLQY